MSSKTKKKKGVSLLKNKRAILSLIAILLAVVMLALSFVLIFTREKRVLSYEGYSLREDVYSYWFSAYKYQYLIAYKHLDISDTEAGWSEIDEASGKSYNDAFKSAIDREIALRFIASVLFDKSGASLSEGDLEAISTTLLDMEEYAYGEKMYKILRREYGVGRSDLKRIALYETKYKALLSVRFGADYSGVYATEYKEALAEFFSKHYKRYNFVYLSDEENAEAQANLRKFIVGGTTEEAFTEWERDYSESRVTEDYPNGIYLYDGMRYTGVFSEELLSAFASLEVGKCCEVRNAKDNGSYFVMRYTLDEAPYLSSDAKVQKSLDGFAEYAARSFYREELEECLDDALWVTEITDAYTPVAVKKEQDYNIVNLLG